MRFLPIYTAIKYSIGTRDAYSLHLNSAELNRRPLFTSITYYRLFNLEALAPLVHISYRKVGAIPNKD